MPSCTRAGAEYVGQEEERGDAGAQRPAQIFPPHRVDLAPVRAPIGCDEFLVAQPLAPHAGRNRGNHLDDLVITARGDVADRKVPVVGRLVNDLPAGLLALATQPRLVRDEPRVTRRNLKVRR